MELLWPYELSIPEFKALLEAHHLKLALFNTRAGDISKGEWGLAALPGRECEARAHIDEALEYAAGLDCPTVHVMAGVVKGLDRERCFETLKENVAYACEKAAPHGITITLEALCPAVKENYLYKSQYDTLQVVKDLNLSNLKVQYDLQEVRGINPADFTEAQLEGDPQDGTTMPLHLLRVATEQAGELKDVEFP